MNKHYIPIYKSPHDEDRFYIEINNSMYPVLLNTDNTCYIDNLKYENNPTKYNVVTEGDNQFIEVTLESINKTFRITEEELSKCSTKLNFSITPQIEYDEEIMKMLDSIPDNCEVEDCEMWRFLVPSIEDRELLDFFEKLKSENVSVVDEYGIPMKNDELQLKKASPEKIKELESKLEI